MRSGATAGPDQLSEKTGCAGAREQARRRFRSGARNAFSGALVAVLLGSAWEPLAAQPATGELYGDFRYSANLSDDGTASVLATANNASRLGYRGGIERGPFALSLDLQAGVNVDANGAGAAFTPRYYVLELQSPAGSVALGRRSTQYKLTGLRIDPWYDSSTLSVGAAVPRGGLFAGASFGLSNLTNGFADGTVAYTTPSLHGLTANAGVQVNADADHDLAAGATYRRDGLEAGIQYYDARGDAWTQTAGLDDGVRAHALLARSERWSVGLSAERVTSTAGVANDYLYASGTMRVLPVATLGAAIGRVDDEGDLQTIGGTGLHAGIWLDALPRTRLSLLYSAVDPAEGGSGRTPPSACPTDSRWAYRVGAPHSGAAHRRHFAMERASGDCTSSYCRASRSAQSSQRTP